MSRAIKFRAWDERTHKMFPVASVHFGDDGSALTITADLAPKEHGYSTLDKLIVHGESGALMQFTGMVDKNGREIYEGDILSGRLYRYGYELERWNKVYTGVVQWIQRDQLYGFFLVDKAGTPMNLLYATHRNQDFNGDILVLEIIGNIYENPDLLKVSEP